MGTAWETLFHLTNFMKHLLVEVLPKERVDCPKYVMDSLLELLSITLESLNAVRNFNNPGKESLRKTFQKETVNAATASLEHYASNTNDRVSYESHENIQSTPLVNDITVEAMKYAEINSQPTDSVRSKKNIKAMNIENKGLTVTMHKCTVITQSFVTFNNEILASRLSGYYCLPCDSCFSAEDEWEDHHNSSGHAARIKKQICEELSCERCNLIVFGNMLIAPVYIDYHYESHRMFSFNASNESFSKGGSSSKEDSPLPNRQQISSKGSINDFVSPTFEKAQHRILKGYKKEAFYCYFCDVKCFSIAQWTNHFKSIKHSPESENQAAKGMCEICPFTIYAPVTHLNELMKYHSDCHFTFTKSQETRLDVKTSSTDLVSSSGKTTPQNGDQSIEYYEAAIPIKNNEISRPISELNGNNTNLSSEYRYASESDISNYSKEQPVPSSVFRKKKYEFTDNFIYINERIHSQNLVGAFYCRPCDKCCTLDQWKAHSKFPTHIKFMSSDNFKNFIGICSYCELTIIGTERTVHEYMKFHNERHEKILSFSCEAMNDAGNNSNVNETRKVNPTKPKRKPRHRGKNLTINDSAPEPNIDYESWVSDVNSVGGNYGTNYSDDIKDNINTDYAKTQSRPVPTNDDTSGSKSWYDAATDESVQTKITEMYDFRKNEKSSQKSLTFGGFCIPCDLIVESGFEWFDHLTSDEHLKVQGSNVEEFSFPEVSLHIFGNKNVLPQFLLRKK